MPELPEVETVKRGLEPHMVGKTIKDFLVGEKPLRFCDVTPQNIIALENTGIVSLSRRGKYLCVHLNNSHSLIHHLGMSGSFRSESSKQEPENKKHDHLIYTLKDNARIIYNDPRRFGMVFYTSTSDIDNHSAFKHMGEEPLGNRFNGNTLHEALKARKSPIKSALLDQRNVAGLGNIYVCEALFLSQISPLTPANTLTETQCSNLVVHIRNVLQGAISSGGSSLRDHLQVSGETGYFQHNFKVYDREGLACEGCTCDIDETGGIKRIKQSGRSTFYCPKIQR